MRVEEYTRELTGRGYRILSTSGTYEDHSSYYGDPIEMSMMYFRNDDKGPIFDNLEELIRAAKVELIADPGETVFDEIYPDVMRGNCPNWQLGEVQVYPDGVLLIYGNEDLGEEEYVRIEGVSLGLTFKTSRTRLGFDPTYKVLIRHSPDGTPLFTRVDEDLGYMRRIILFELKEQADPKKACLDENQIIHVVEYIGL